MAIARRAARIASAAVAGGALLIVGCSGGGDDGEADADDTSAFEETASPVGEGTERSSSTASATTGSSSPATTAVISPHPPCFDQLLGDEPRVSNANQYYVQPASEPETVRLSQAWPVPSEGANHALFILEDARAVGAVKFSYSEQDVLVVHGVWDGDCAEAQWVHGGTDVSEPDQNPRVHSAAISVAIAEDSPYEVVFQVHEKHAEPQGVVIGKEYYAVTTKR